MVRIRKVFESLDEPSIGDYVLVDVSSENLIPEVKEFLGTHIGKIVEVYFEQWIIHYEDIPKQWIKPKNPTDFRYFHTDGNRAIFKTCVKFWSPDYETVEAVLNGKKFGI